MYQFDINIVYQALPDLLEGLKFTVLISISSSILAFVIGCFVVFFRTMGNSLARFVLSSIVEIIRNTPLLIQLYILYKGLPSIGLNLSPVLCGITALSIYTGVFISEVLRAGISSIAKEQHEASKSLGLTSMQTFRLIIFPQAIKIIIPPLGSQFINLIKNSSLVSFIAVTDIFYVIYKGAVDDFRFFEFFLTGALIYMVLTGFVALITNLIEYKFKIKGRGVHA